MSSVHSFKHFDIRFKQSQRGGIMDLFRTVVATPPVVPPNQNQPGTGNTPPNPLDAKQTQQTGPNGLIPNPDPNAPQPSPLDAHKDVWQTTKTEEPKPLFENFDPVKLREALSKSDIVSKVVTPDILAKIKAGGDDAMAALAQAMNSVGTSVLADSTIATKTIVESALKKQQDQFLAQLPGIIRSASAKDALITANPILSHPTVQPIAEALQAQFLQKNPNATQAEINTQVMDVISAMGQVFAPKPKESPSDKNKKEETDWEALFLNSSEN